MLSEDIPRRAAAMREALGLSRPQVAARCVPPTSGPQIERLEKGHRKFTLEWIERIAPALKTTPQEMISGVPMEISEPTAELVAHFFAKMVMGYEPPRDKVTALAPLVSALLDTLARHPEARRDPAALVPLVDLLGRQSS